MTTICSIKGKGMLHILTLEIYSLLRYICRITNNFIRKKKRNSNKCTFKIESKKRRNLLEKTQAFSLIIPLLRNKK